MAGHTGSWIQVGGGVRGAGGLTHECGGVAPPSQQLREGDLGGREPTGRRGEQEHAHNAVCSHACGVTEDKARSRGQDRVTKSRCGHGVSVGLQGYKGQSGIGTGSQGRSGVSRSVWGHGVGERSRWGQGFTPTRAHRIAPCEEGGAAGRAEWGGCEVLRQLRALPGQAVDVWRPVGGGTGRGAGPATSPRGRTSLAVPSMQISTKTKVLGLISEYANEHGHGQGSQ